MCTGLSPASVSDLTDLPSDLVSSLLAGVSLDELPTWRISSEEAITYLCTETGQAVTLTAFGFISSDTVYHRRPVIFPVGIVTFHIEVTRVLRPGQVYRYNGLRARNGRRGPGDTAAG